MTPPAGSLDSAFLTVILASLAIGLPVVIVLLVRYLWDRNVRLGRSKDLDKLIWQLHRIASAMESQKNLSFPAVQPGTEEARDLAFLKPIAVEAKHSGPSTTTASTAAEPLPQAQAANAVMPNDPGSRPLPPLETGSGPQPRAGVNSMFDL